MPFSDTLSQIALRARQGRMAGLNKDFLSRHELEGRGFAHLGEDGSVPGALSRTSRPLKPARRRPDRKRDMLSLERAYRGSLKRRVC